jgi:hypothetical protein
MKSVRAAALRLILPLLARTATVDFFGAVVLFGVEIFEEDFVELAFAFDEALRDDETLPDEP